MYVHMWKPGPQAGASQSPQLGFESRQVGLALTAPVYRYTYTCMCMCVYIYIHIHIYIYIYVHYDII